MAYYKKTHDDTYKNRYLQRLRYIGFSEREAEGMFMYELLTIKHDSVELLCVIQII